MLASNDSDCAMPCSGNNSETCGGPSLLSVFNTTGIQLLGHPATVDGYTYQGCWAEGSNSRALTGASLVNSTGMTVEQCIGFCSASSWGYAGLEYGSECWCGNSLAAGQAAPQADCNMLCSGAPLEYCGSGNRLDLYKAAAQTKSKRFLAGRKSSKEVAWW